MLFIKTIMKKKIKIITLGCAKNTVDSEVIAGILEQGGMEIAEGDENADTVLINTCSFIEKAREESIDVILEAALEKSKGNIKKIIVTGCMPERYGKELSDEISEIDEIAGIDEIPEILSITLNGRGKRNKSGFEGKALSEYLYDHHTPRKKLTPSGVSYIKISDGCNNRCAYCAIPLIRGNLRCRSISSITQEAKKLADNGTVEINLLANDLTSFEGNAKSGENLSSLLSALSKVDGLKWIRPLYLYPSRIDDTLIETIGENENICNYFDMPLQHADNRILEKMGRKYRIEDIQKKIEVIRKKIPDAVLRTTFITGFPGEDEDSFNRLMDFIRETRFDRVGVFAYSKEEGTPAAEFKDTSSRRKAEEMALEIGEVQKEISAEKLSALKGRVTEAIVEAPSSEPNVYEGRIRSQAPEVDGMTFISGEKLACGKIYEVEIEDTIDYDIWSNATDEGD